MRSVPLALGFALATAAWAQNAPPQTSSTATLNLRKSAGVRLGFAVGEGHRHRQRRGRTPSIDQRLALLASQITSRFPPMKSNGCANGAGADRQLHSGRQAEEITDADIDKTVARVAGNVKPGPDGGLSQVPRFIDPFDPPPDSGRNHGAGCSREDQAPSASATRVKAVIDKLTASKSRGIPGRRNLHFGQQRHEEQAAASAQRAPLSAFNRAAPVGYARQFSKPRPPRWAAI